MRRTGWIVIAAFAGIPAIMFSVLWGCWRGGTFDSVPEPGAVEISALFRAGDAVECSLAPMHPGHDLVRYELLPPEQVEGGEAPMALVRVWQRPKVFGKEAGARLQITVPLPAADSRIGLVHTGASAPSVIWPPPPLGDGNTPK